MTGIERKAGAYRGRNKSSAYRDLVWTVAIAVDTGQGMAGQTQSALNVIQQNLLELGSDKSLIVSAQVFVADMQLKPEMDQQWCEWIGGDPTHWPQRACLGVDLEGDVLVEIVVTAVRQ
jgi:enamine deaminase RidA (YjgF/YER057c/UK114 family)